MGERVWWEKELISIHGGGGGGGRRGGQELISIGRELGLHSVSF